MLTCIKEDQHTKLIFYIQIYIFIIFI